MAPNRLLRIDVRVAVARANRSRDALLYPLVTVDEFFTGNDDPGSIGCNLLEHPGTATFRRVLESVLARPDVSAVAVEVTDTFADGEDAFPFYSERVWVFTSLGPEAVAKLVRELQPSTVEARSRAPRGVPRLPRGMNAILLWWD
jgi:hypothetical protein